LRSSPHSTLPHTRPNLLIRSHQIRDLEARVEILSGDKDERIELMLLLVRNLLHENKELRNMIKDMSQFFGEGESAVVLSAAKLAWQRPPRPER
jgi:hypothetical protein